MHLNEKANDAHDVDHWQNWTTIEGVSPSIDFYCKDVQTCLFFHTQLILRAELEIGGRLILWGPWDKMSIIKLIKLRDDLFCAEPNIVYVSDFAHPLWWKTIRWVSVTHKPATMASKKCCYVGIQILYSRNHYICNFENI